MKKKSIKVPNSQHIRFDVFREGNDYKFPNRPRTSKKLRDNYADHAKILKSELIAALDSQSNSEVDPRIPIDGLSLGNVVGITTKSPNENSNTQSINLPNELNIQSKEIKILKSYRNEDKSETGLLFVPDKSQEYLIKSIDKYGKTPVNQSSTKSKPVNVKRFEPIEEINDKYIESLFSFCTQLPYNKNAWFELWCRNSDNLVEELAIVAENNDLEVHENKLYFPEITVLFVHTKKKRLEHFAQRVPGSISEIRPADRTIELILDYGNSGKDQFKWVENVVSRVQIPKSDSSVVCSLDTGISASHDLIKPGLKYSGTVNNQWGVDDDGSQGGHGTPLSGLILYGDLIPILNDTRKIKLSHHVESMKLLPPSGFPPTKREHYGIVTENAVNLVEINDPTTLRSYCLAITAIDNPPEIPSTWSACIDQIISGSKFSDVEDLRVSIGLIKRLFLIAAGNASHQKISSLKHIPTIEDPAQCWNALTIGGFTRKDEIPNPPPNFSLATDANTLSPYTRGSSLLPFNITPIKPEVLFEAGNMLVDGSGYLTNHESVSLLAPGSDVSSEPLVPFCATSAAVGVAGNFLGRLQSKLPNLWPETHRALVVDSASWPSTYKKLLTKRGKQGWGTSHGYMSKTARQTLLRDIGYGVPKIDRAIFSAKNDVTLVAQSEIQPFKVGNNRNGVFNEMHFYKLPWPKKVLEEMENKIVTMKVTLSYFIEPNLAGYTAYRPENYRSFGLNFRMKKRNESSKLFRSRTNNAMEKVESGSQPEVDNWLLGETSRRSGSLHCDLWRGYAIDLAGHDEIAVYPVGGWWKSSKDQVVISSKTRYSLVISISGKKHDVDIYSEISNLVEQKMKLRKKISL